MKFLKGKLPDDEETKWTNKILKKLNLKTGRDLHLVQIKSDVKLLADLFEKLIETFWEDKLIPVFFYFYLVMLGTQD